MFGLELNLEEIEALKRMEKDKGWQVTNQILLLSAELLKVKDCEVSTEDILDQPHDTNDHTLQYERIRLML